MEKIVEEVLAGKKGAATRFYKVYAPKLKSFLINKLPSEADAQDVLQETFLSAFDSLPMYQGGSSLSTWIYSIARHEVADFYRKRYIRQAVEKTSPLFDNMVSEVLSPEFVLEKKKIEQRFMGAFSSLSAEHQDALSFRYELSMSVREISERMKMSFKATESLLFRARVAFREAYERGE